MEAGAGSGHFARGVLQTLANQFQNVFASTRYVIDEISVPAQTLCREQLKMFGDQVEFASVGNVRLEAGVIFSNELLDAFPVHRLTLQGSELREFFVDVDANGNFAWVIRAPSTARLQAHLDLCGTELLEGQIVEVNLELENWVETMAASLRQGFVISVDYGATASDLYASSPDDPRFGGTLRGFRRHSFVDDVLANPGGHDLTASVNWTAVEKLGELHQLQVIDFKPQDKFLIDAGLLNQLEIESRNVNGDADKLRLSTAAREMILPDGMAVKFQVMTQRKRVM